MASYPIGLPAPQIADYSISTATGLMPIRFERGNVRQRRTAQRHKQTFTMTFMLTINQLWSWQLWANESGYDWHTMFLESPYSGLSVSGANLIPHSIRYVSDFSIQVVTQGDVRATVIAEMDVTTLPQGIVTFTGNWIRAGIPATPSSANYYRAGIPATPSTDTLTAGSPAIPAA